MVHGPGPGCGLLAKEMAGHTHMHGGAFPPTRASAHGRLHMCAGVNGNASTG